MLFCSFCGERLPAPDVRFCGSCGGDLAELAEPGAAWQGHPDPAPESPRRPQRAPRPVRAAPAEEVEQDWLLEPEPLPARRVAARQADPANRRAGAGPASRHRQFVALAVLAVMAIVVFVGGMALGGGYVAAPWSAAPTPRVIFVTLPPDWYLPDP